MTWPAAVVIVVLSVSLVALASVLAYVIVRGAAERERTWRYAMGKNVGEVAALERANAASVQRVEKPVHDDRFDLGLPVGMGTD